MRKDQYIIKAAYKKPVVFTKVAHMPHYIPLEDNTCRFDEEGYPIPEGVSLLNPNICSAILCNYARMKQDSAERFDGDLYYLMDAFDELAEKALKDYPLYKKIVEYKIDGLQNI